MKHRQLSPTSFLSASIIMVGLMTLGTFGMAAQRGGGSAGRSFGSVQSSGGGVSYGGYGYSQPYYGGYGGGLPYGGTSNYSPAYSYLPAYWWAGPYASSDPRGEGYNPNAGYAWDSVSVLLLETYPLKARVTLDGIFVGTNDCLGPFQLPAGDHTLRVDAAGFESSTTVLRVVQPILQQLQVKLTEVAHGGKPGPQK